MIMLTNLFKVILFVLMVGLISLLSPFSTVSEISDIDVIWVINTVIGALLGRVIVTYLLDQMFDKVTPKKVVKEKTQTGYAMLVSDEYGVRAEVDYENPKLKKHLKKQIDDFANMDI